MGLFLAQLHNNRGKAGNALRRMDKPDPQDMDLVLPKGKRQNIQHEWNVNHVLQVRFRVAENESNINLPQSTRGMQRPRTSLGDTNLCNRNISNHSHQALRGPKIPKAHENITNILGIFLILRRHLDVGGNRRRHAFKEQPHMDCGRNDKWNPYLDDGQVVRQEESSKPFRHGVDNFLLTNRHAHIGELLSTIANS
jgi:hypothetical protein